MPWDDAAKPRDRDQPFHRINLVPVQPPDPQADGFGYRCGCRSPNDVPAASFDPLNPGDSANSARRAVARELIRAIPGWVPVTTDARERELEGRLDRSFQTWTDVPVFQWHRYYDWNFHVVPADGLGYLKGLGNTQDPVASPLRHVTSAGSMECEWDCGAWFAGASDRTPGLMFTTDLCWPMSTGYFWGTGRWIYDCGHATSFDKTGANEGRMRTELHPLKAIATARWEAFKFDENPLHVPAIQLMFFASRFGGYVDFPTIRDRDYEFLIDLPDLGFPPSTLISVGHTMSDPLNTAAARAPELLSKADFAPFAHASGRVRSVNPEVTLHTLSPPQAKVKIPMSRLPADTDAFGVVLSLGWKDPDRALARKVRKCTVTIEKVVVKDADHETTPEEWFVKVGVNGRWVSKTQTSIRDGNEIPFGNAIPLFLSEDDSIVVSSHGGELNLVHDVFARPRANRRLAGVADYDRDVVRCSPATSLTHLDNMIAMMASTVNDQNEPLGLIDPGRAAHGADNPLTIGGSLGEVNFALKAFFTEEVGRSAELAENSSKHEYTLHYKVKIEPLPGS